MVRAVYGGCEVRTRLSPRRKRYERLRDKKDLNQINRILK